LSSISSVESVHKPGFQRGFSSCLCASRIVSVVFRKQESREIDTKLLAYSLLKSTTFYVRVCYLVGDQHSATYHVCDIPFSGTWL